MNFSEILLIAAVAFVVIGPKELPTVVHYIAAFLRELRGITSGVRAQFNDVMRDAGLDDVIDQTTTIIDLEGKPQKAYDVRGLKTLEAPKTPPTTKPTHD